MEEIADFLRHSAAAPHWERIGIKHHHGVAIPLFSLHSNQSCGIGEFTDLLPLLPWCKDIGLDVIQLLPLNDTGLSPSPYGALSACALNPVHLGLAALPFVEENAFLQSMLKEIRTFNSSNRVLYPQIHPLRSHFLKEYFQAYSSQFLSCKAYIAFQNENPWLEEYALFKAIKIAHEWDSWSLWPENMRDPTPEKLALLKQQFEADIAYHSLVQFFCFQQLEMVKQKATEHAIFLKGDVPIFLDKESADVWLHRNLFDLELSAGAPPDGYSDQGQNWGFPLYNWPEMEKLAYDWWKERIRTAARCYHIYRIDHIVGMFRIWAVPPSKAAKMGHFIPENTEEWIPHGEKILRMLLEAAPMLPIGEDLGTVPPAVKACLQRLGICGTRVMRWERRWEQEGHPYIPFNEYAPLGLTTVSTHDSEPLQLWWEKLQEEAKAYAEWQGWHYTVPLSQGARTAILQSSHHTSTLFHINPLQEYLARFPELIWSDPLLERINIPGVVSEQNWSYRFRPSTEEIVADQTLTSYISGLIR